MTAAAGVPQTHIAKQVSFGPQNAEQVETMAVFILRWVFHSFLRVPSGWDPSGPQLRLDSVLDLEGPLRWGPLRSPAEVGFSSGSPWR